MYNSMREINVGNTLNSMSSGVVVVEMLAEVRWMIEFAAGARRNAIPVHPIAITLLQIIS